MADVGTEAMTTDAVHQSPTHSGDGQGASSRRSPALVGGSDVSVKKIEERAQNTSDTASPGHESSRSSPSKLLLPVLSEGSPDQKKTPSGSQATNGFATIESERRLTSPIQFPPRSAAISSRRGRSRSPSSRSPSSMSMHSSSSPTLGLMIHKDSEAMGANIRADDRRIAKKDSRDDGATTVSSSSATEPANVSSAAAAAAAAAASFSATSKQRSGIDPSSKEGEMMMQDSITAAYPQSRHQHHWPGENQSKRSREFDADGGGYPRKSSRGAQDGEDGGGMKKAGHSGMRGPSNRFSSSSRGRPAYRSSQHSSSAGGGGRIEHSNWNVDDPNSPNRCVSGGNLPHGGSTNQNPYPFHEDRGRTSPVPASAVTSSSSTSLSPAKTDASQGGSARGNVVHRLQGNEVAMPPRTMHSLDTPPASFDDRQEQKEVLSPVDPPQIQLSHHQQQIFSPKEFFEEGDKNTLSPIDHKTATAPNATLEIAGSFNLFNHSFDSLGGMPELDGLNSFGIVASTEGPSMSFPQQQDRSPKNNQTKATTATKGSSESNPSGRNVKEKLKQPILNGSSSGGSMKMFGSISPSTSFDPVISVGGENAAIADLVLNSTASQILNELSPSGSYQKENNDRPPYRPPARYGNETTPPRHPGNSNHIIGPADGHQQNFSSPGVPPNGPPSFYVVLRRWRKAFVKFTFVLPGLKVRETCSVNVSAVGNITVYSGHGRKDNNSANGKDRQNQKAAFMPEPSVPGRSKKFPDPNPSEIAIASRRVISAVCAFGGSCQQAASRPSSSSIFRTKYNGHGDGTLVKTEAQVKYEEQLPNRYYENENRLSWEVEENPPIEVVTDDEDGQRRDSHDRKSNKKNRGGKDAPSSVRSNQTPGTKSEFPPTSPSPAMSSSSEQPKMKYRCKLCGLPKQNHTCPYQQSLQRNIGIMVYPAINAFTSNEPGRLAPPLTDMNNFTGGDDSSSNDNSPPRLKHDDVSTTTAGSFRVPVQQGHAGSPHNVTPETMRSSVHTHSPGSSLSGTPEGTPYRRMGRSRSHFSPHRPMRRGDYSQMNGFGTELSADPLFVEPMDTKPEQFRIVSSSGQNTSKGAYTYASLPLPYGQRKRLSDSLFAMSKEVPGLTDECAVALREARQKGKWDLAVAELMTQVVIIMHCRENDNTLEGLRRYLLTLGIAC